ncbi:hypothetical protein F5H01DRAFT_371398 [Linnemannia elongata]|nr:hypothetical protein F5H01DRAFT_371398 [Linnemannia elongata]
MQQQQHLQTTAIQMQQQQQQQQQAQQQDRLDSITKLSDTLKVLSPTVADAKIVELAETFENVIYQRSPNKSEYLKAYTRRLQQIRFQIIEEQQSASGSSIVGSPR